MKAFLLLRKFNSKSGSFTKLRKEAKESRGLKPVYFAEEGECDASKELRAFSCGPLVAYLLGYEDYYKVDSDELVDRVVNILVHYK